MDDGSYLIGECRFKFCEGYIKNNIYQLMGALFFFKKKRKKKVCACGGFFFYMQ
jgi:hypothetical protein